jgi:hypothetical protein
MTDMAISLVQASDGSLTGTYTAIGTAGLQFCSDTGPCTISGTITGSNTVLQIFVAMSDAGNFTGQAIGNSTMRGAMNRIGATDTVEFKRP